MALEKHFDLIFRTAEGLMTLLPRTVAEQVYMYDGHTVADHIHSNRHLLPTERFAMDRVNQAGGFIVLDARGYVPLSFIPREMLAIQTEYSDISDMLENGGNIAKGYLVFVNDAFDDARVGRHIWAIYRRNSEADFSKIEAWSCMTAGFTLDIDLQWDKVPGIPESSPEAIDRMVEHEHTHDNADVLNNLVFTDDRFTYKNRKVAYDAEVARFFNEDRFNGNLRIGDFWLKESYSQSWWYDTTIENAGESCYELYRGYTTMTTSPKIRTHETTDMTRMFYGDSALKTVQQYKVNNVKLFTQMFGGCTSLIEVPCMGSYSGTNFEQMFEGATMLKESPDMILNNATTVYKMYSNCVNLEYVLPFGSTSKVKNFREMFSGCESLKVIYSPIDFSSAENVVGMFNGCIDLEELNFVEGTLKTSLSLANTNLSVSSLMNILNGLPVVTNSPTLTLTGIDALNDLPTSAINTALLKGWNIEPSVRSSKSG